MLPRARPLEDRRACRCTQSTASPGDATAAAGQYATGKANAPKLTDEVAGVGSGGYGSLTPGSGSEAYTL